MITKIPNQQGWHPLEVERDGDTVYIDQQESYKEVDTIAIAIEALPDLIKVLQAYLP